MKKNERLKISPVETLKEDEMNNSIKKSLGSLHGLRRWQSGAIMLLLLLAVGCSTVKYVPVKGETIIRDSIIYIERVDTVKVQLPPVKVKDYTALGDTLKLSDGYSNAWAAVDAEREMLVGGIETDSKASIDVPVKEKEKIVYRDSVRTVEVPIPVEVPKEVKVIPKFWRITGVFGLISLVLLLTFTGLKIYRFFKGRNILK